jgi:hypothetical protein
MHYNSMCTTGDYVRLKFQRHDEQRAPEVAGPRGSGIRLHAAEASQPVEPTMCTKNSIQAEESDSVQRTRMKVRVVGETQSAKVIMAPARRSHPNTLGVHVYLVAIRTLDSA